jgi:hypothetical protein
LFRLLPLLDLPRAWARLLPSTRVATRKTIPTTTMPTATMMMQMMRMASTAGPEETMLTATATMAANGPPEATIKLSRRTEVQTPFRVYGRALRGAPPKVLFFFSNAAGIKGDASATEPHPRGARCDRPLGRNPEISEMFAAADLRLHLRSLGCFTAGKLN